MLTTIVIKRQADFPSYVTKSQVVNFLFDNLDRFRDTKEAISLAMDYCFSDDLGKGGFVILMMDQDAIVGAVVINKTGMTKYIPENILVYIAVKSDMRGMGLGEKLLREAFSICNGDIALHVEYDNPAKRLYERVGFTSKYAEMRWHKDS